MIGEDIGFAAGKVHAPTVIKNGLPRSGQNVITWSHELSQQPDLEIVVAVYVQGQTSHLADPPTMRLQNAHESTAVETGSLCGSHLSAVQIVQGMVGHGNTV